MAWSFYCADEKMNITADNKEELAMKLMQHMQENHDTKISQQQAMEMINMGAQQSAA